MPVFVRVLETAINLLGWLCSLLSIATPLVYVTAVLGSRWEFIDWQFGLDVMIHQWGPILLLICAVTAVLAIIAIIIHRFAAREWFGVVTAPVLAFLVAIAGFGWKYEVDQTRANTPYLIDIATDVSDPPHFTSGFVTRRSLHDAPLDYVAKTGPDGRSLAELQRAAYPELTTLERAGDADAIYREALALARNSGWRVGTASEAAGMFEATGESFWFAFKDDMVVRIRTDEETGLVRIDVRSLARQDMHDLGRNAQRVQAFLAGMDPARADTGE